MSRFKRALAAATTAVAAAGNGLLISAAGAVPAYASAPAAQGPPAVSPGGLSATITVYPPSSTKPKGGVAPHTTPCGPAGGICGPHPPAVNICRITADTPRVTTQQVFAAASVTCDAPVPEIWMEQTVEAPWGNTPSEWDRPQGADFAVTHITTTCQAGAYTNTATAQITFPPGTTTNQGPSNVATIGTASGALNVYGPECDPSPPPPPPAGGGGGGGGDGGSSGCNIASRPPDAHPAGRHPNLITC